MSHVTIQKKMLSLQETTFLYIPNNAVGAIIGTKGTHIRNIIRFSGASVKIAPLEQEKPQDQQTERKVTIVGSPESQWKVMLQVVTLLFPHSELILAGHCSFFLWQLCWFLQVSKFLYEECFQILVHLVITGKLYFHGLSDWRMLSCPIDHQMDVEHIFHWVLATL